MIQIKSYQDEQVFYIILEGDVDASTSMYLDQALNNAAFACKQTILVNCRELNYISSAGIGVFMSYLLLLKERNCELILTEVSKKIWHTVQMLDIASLITIIPVEKE